MTNGLLTVLVSSYNQLPLLKLAFESYGMQKGVMFDVVVADDGSTDGTREWVESSKFSFATSVISSAHGGYGLVKAWNRAAAAAAGSRLLFTNADMIHLPGSFVAHARVEGIGGGVVRGLGPKSASLLTADTVRTEGALERLRKESWADGNMDFVASVSPIKNVVGILSANMSTQKASFDEVGGFDEGYCGKWGCENYDLVDRMMESGCWAEWVTESVAYHAWHPLAEYALLAEGCRRYVGGAICGKT